MEDDDKVGMKTFNSHNFGYWMTQVTDMLHAKGHKDVLLENESLSTMKLVWEKMDHKALDII